MSTKDNRSNHNDDLKGIQGISINPMDTPFIVPENYFDFLPAKIQRRIKVIEDTTSSFTLPEGYFDSLSERIEAKIEESEFENAEEQNNDLAVDDYSFIKEISFISELKSKIPAAGFETPPSYFENLTKKIEESIKEQVSEESVVSIHLQKERKVKRLTWIGYAAAACIAFSIGAYAFFQLNSVNNFQKKLHNISENEIVSYLEYYTEPGDVTNNILETEFEGAVQTNKAKFSEEDIEAYLDYSI